MRISTLRKLVEQFSAGGGGLVVGAWSDVPVSALPAEAQALSTLSVPSEVALVFVPTANTSGGFWIADANTNESFATETQSWGDWTPTVTLRAIIPAGRNVEIRPLFGGSGYIAQSISRRTLG